MFNDAFKAPSYDLHRGSKTTLSFNQKLQKLIDNYKENIKMSRNKELGWAFTPKFYFTLLLHRNTTIKSTAMTNVLFVLFVVVLRHSMRNSA